MRTRRLPLQRAALSFAILALTAPAFNGSAEPISPQLRQRISGVSWHRGCPVGFGELRLLRLTHWGFDGEVHRGRLVVNRDSAGAMLRTMRQLYRLRFPIRRSLAEGPGVDPPPRTRCRRLRRERLGVGRELGLAEGLPALLGERALTQAAAAP